MIDVDLLCVSSKRPDGGAVCAVRQGERHQRQSFRQVTFSLLVKFSALVALQIISSARSHSPNLTVRLSCRSPSKPLARKLLGGTDWESVSRNSLSDERLETQSLPTRSPPGTPNQWVSRFTSGQKTHQYFIARESFTSSHCDFGFLWIQQSH